MATSFAALAMCSPISALPMHGMRLKSRIATEIARALDRRKLSVRAAAKETSATAADISRIRNADLDRFSLDRLVRIADRLGCRIAIKVSKAA
jgi:predicted XRE-type DNA-binding protein